MCANIVLHWVLNALLLMIIPYIVPGIEIASFVTALAVAMALALVNTIIRPILLFLTLPINILTLGLFTIIINGIMFWLVATFIKGFNITGFWYAVLAALVYSVLSILLAMLINSGAPMKTQPARAKRVKSQKRR